MSKVKKGKDKDDAARLAHGEEVLNKIYGPGGAGPIMSLTDSPFVGETVKNLFGEVWDRPGLSVRDRRLLVLGATAMLGRPDLVETQVKGALLGGDMDAEQLEEAVLQLAFYTGWGNATAMWHGVQAALKSAAAETEK
jgi:4-carboxymuconolactone decarboxylase